MRNFRMKSKSALYILLFLLPLTAAAQPAGIDQARQLHSQYKFTDAVALCEKLLDSATDKEEKDRIFNQMLLSENGSSMLMMAAEPRIVAKVKVPRADFFLWYSHLQDRSWTADGNFYPAGKTTYYFSENGDIYETSKKDSVLWSAPQVPSPDMKSSGSEIFPMLSPDGKELFFSSDGLFGMGGYDLFVSRWDEDQKKWGPVQNLGFPFSSTADDLLYTYTPDNSHIIFASNRECDKNSVVIYVARYENYLHTMISEDEARELASLPVSGTYKEDYKLVKHSLGSKPSIQMEEVEPEYDLSFTVGKTSVVVPENKLPNGISYQIRIMLTNAKVKKPATFKGLSPVFEEKQSSSKYIYYVGIFRKYADAQSALKKVKPKFSGAYVVAYENGKPLQIAKAREKESKITVVSEEVRIVTAD